MRHLSFKSTALAGLLLATLSFQAHADSTTAKQSKVAAPQSTLHQMPEGKSLRGTTNAKSVKTGKLDGQHSFKLVTYEDTSAHIRWSPALPNMVKDLFPVLKRVVQEAFPDSANTSPVSKLSMTRDDYLGQSAWSLDTPEVRYLFVMEPDAAGSKNVQGAKVWRTLHGDTKLLSKHPSSTAEADDEEEDEEMDEDSSADEVVGEDAEHEGAAK